MLLINKISDFFLKVESKVSALLVGLIVALILFNVLTRSIGYAVYWVDELVIYLMVWMVFITMPTLVAKQKNISVDLFLSFMNEKTKDIFMFVIEIVILFVSIFLVYLSLGWFMPFELLRVDFDFTAFSEETFNYIYDEPTNTLPIKKYWFWLVVPISSFLCSIHSLSNVISLAKKIVSREVYSNSEASL